MALSKKEIKITTLLVIDTVFFLLEIIIGYTVNSLALIADSFHMLNDIISLIVALWAVNVAKNRSADAEYTYGWLRAEILGALINAVFLIALCFTILIEALQRMLSPPVITNAQLILTVGTCGLLSNIVGLFLFHEHGHSHDDETTHSHSHKHHKSLSGERSPLLSSDPAAEDQDLRQVLPSYVVGQLDENASSSTKLNASGSRKKAAHQKSLNMQGVFLHVLGDALGNVGVMLTALFIWKTDYSWKYYTDPFISLVITCIIFSSALPLCKRSSRILLQGTPLTVETSDVIQDILQIPSVLGVHDFHIWNLTEKLLIASLHVELNSSPESFLKIATEIKSCLHDYGIHSATIQPEFSAYYSQQHMLPHSFSSTQNLSHAILNNATQDEIPNPQKNLNRSSSEIHCLVDASANCTTGDCLK
ncbi:hypothetical protein PICMEDRAFT_34482 [Pichia membranifaciens NRRL Y-2026]|uniref:Uncharacterized protein n=1 Tax=Pichia membranifaciens NRRL Y-2026 TaxID=763406 RepID=A0A1E3NII2_9ASCO|nr:hypothetical protein PICMEDRAFT_34482 [Pichia membranifaciens NRRL Y-2026]ODQ45940.1 hypothetical protein PICMEDRAFT_34482 [Pichia membranifaciens NRRL Y-2026]